MGKLDPTDLEKETKNVLKSLDYSADPSRDNEAWVQDQLNNYTARGLSKEDARRRVKDKLQNHSIEINGKILIDEDGLPKDAPVLLDRALKDAFAVFGKAEGIPDVSDLYVDKFASGQWIIMSKTKAGPLNFGSRIGLDGLAKKRSEMDREKRTLQDQALSEDKAKRAAACEKLKSYLNDQKATVEHWENTAKGSANGWSAWVARKLRENYDYDLMKFNKPPRNHRDPVPGLKLDRSKPYYDDNGFMPPLSPRKPL